MFDFRPGKSPGLSRNKPQRREPTTNSIQKWLCLSVSSLLHSCHAILLPGGALRDDTKNGCVADYSDSNPGTCSHNCVIPAPPPPPSPLPPLPFPLSPLPSPQAILWGEQLSFFFLLQVLFRHVLFGEITVDRLVRMTPEQLASPELATWREQETKHVSFLLSAVLISTMHLL